LGQRLRGGVVVEPLDHHLHIALASCVNVDCALDSVVQNTCWVIAIAAVVLAPCVPALFCAGFATTLGVPFKTSLDHALLGRVPVIAGVGLCKGCLAKELGWIRVATITLGVEAVFTRVLRGTGNALSSFPAAAAGVGIGSLAKELGGIRVATVTLGGTSITLV